MSLRGARRATKQSQSTRISSNKQEIATLTDARNDISWSIFQKQTRAYLAVINTLSDPIRILNLSRTLTQPAAVGYCDSFLCRLRGLMFRSSLMRDDGLLLVEKSDSRINSSIHMLFVPFDLAVFWINSEMTIVDKVLAKAWRPAYLPKAAAKFTLELHPDRWSDYEIGDKVEIILK